MNRYILTMIIISASICCMKNKAKAWTNVLPTPVISNPQNQYVGVYVEGTTGKLALFDGGDSDDPDNSQENDIISYYWEAGKWNGINYPTIETDGTRSGQHPGWTFTQPGIYQIRLWVQDIDYEWSNHCAWCNVFVFSTTITGSPAYSAYGSGKDFTYDVLTNDQHWLPDNTDFYIYWPGHIYRHEELESIAVDYSSEVYSWDGKDGSGNWLDPGSYYAVIEAKKQNDVSAWWFNNFEELAQYYSPEYVWNYYGYDTEEDYLLGWYSSADVDEMLFTQIKLDLSVDIDGDNYIDSTDETGEENPGKYINVNWNDDDGDGWTNNAVPPSASYTGDKDDSEISSANGDTDFREIALLLEPLYTIQQEYPDSKIKLTFPNKIKVWTTKSKKKSGGTSSELATNAEISLNDLPISLYVEGFSGSSTIRDVEFKATWTEDNNVKDTVKITVFEVDLAGFFSYGNQQTDNDKKMSTFDGSSDHTGKISWDDADGDGTPEGISDMDDNCKYFSNCMECQGTVKPSGVTSEVEFDLEREMWGKAWKKKGTNPWEIIDDYTGSWADDDPSDLLEDDEDKTPSNNNHIYQIDGPGFTQRLRTINWDYLANVYNFREYIIVKINGICYQCSNYYKWHSQTYTKPKDGTSYMTRDDASKQKLGSGWIEVPANP